MEKRLIIVFSTVDDTKQGVGRAECTEAIGDDYATVAEGREVQIPLPQPKKFLGLVPRIFFYLFTFHSSLFSLNEEFFWQVIGNSE